MSKTSSSLRERRTAWQFPGWFSKISLSSWTISLYIFIELTIMATFLSLTEDVHWVWLELKLIFTPKTFGHKNDDKFYNVHTLDIQIFFFSSLNFKMSERSLLWSNSYFTFHWSCHQTRFYNIRFICNYQMQWYVMQFIDM